MLLLFCSLIESSGWNLDRKRSGRSIKILLISLAALNTGLSVLKTIEINGMKCAYLHVGLLPLDTHGFERYFAIKSCYKFQAWISQVRFLMLMVLNSANGRGGGGRGGRRQHLGPGPALWCQWHSGLLGEQGVILRDEPKHLQQLWKAPKGALLESAILIWS